MCISLLHHQRTQLADRYQTLHSVIEKQMNRGHALEGLESCGSTNDVLVDTESQNSLYLSESRLSDESSLHR